MVRCRVCNKNTEVPINKEFICFTCFDKDRRRVRPVVINVPQHQHKRIVIDY